MAFALGWDSKTRAENQEAFFFIYFYFFNFFLSLWLHLRDTAGAPRAAKRHKINLKAGEIGLGMRTKGFEPLGLSQGRFRGGLVINFFTYNKRINCSDCPRSLVVLAGRGTARARLGSKQQINKQNMCVFSWGLWLGTGNPSFFGFWRGKREASENGTFRSGTSCWWPRDVAG